MLPSEFTSPAGWGDIVVGVAADLGAAALLFRARRRASGWRFSSGTSPVCWTFSPSLATPFACSSRIRPFVEPFMSLPLAILPTFVVPIVIVSHVLLFGWIPHEGVAPTADTTRRAPA